MIHGPGKRKALAKLARDMKHSARLIAELRESRKVTREMLDQEMTI